jgi:hypothetical protein
MNTQGLLSDTNMSRKRAFAYRPGDREHALRLQEAVIKVMALSSDLCTVSKQHTSSDAPSSNQTRADPTQDKQNE